MFRATSAVGAEGSREFPSQSAILIPNQPSTSPSSSSCLSSSAMLLAAEEVAERLNIGIVFHSRLFS
jgi:hypothetical protein